ncbi:hypothetical protein Trydic_g13121 [Trypoxylus dichotomus]
MTSLSFLRTALVRLDEPFALERGVSMVSVGKPTKSVSKCTIYKYGQGVENRQRHLYAIDSEVIHTENCQGLFNYSFFIWEDMMSCSKTQEEFSHMEVVKFHGISPVVCDGKLKGYVIAANHSIVGILRIYYDSQWIDTLTGNYPFVGDILNSNSKDTLDLKLFCIPIAFILIH